MNKTLVAILMFGFSAQWLSAQPQTLTQRTVSRDNGFLYQPSKGDFWAPTVIFDNKQFYMFSMYPPDAVWLATSADGVHWKDHGVVLKSEGFKNNRVFMQAVNKVGDRFVMNFGAFSDVGSPQNLLRFYESNDLTHWRFSYELPIDTTFYKPDGLWDHMYMIPKDDADRRTGYWGYVVATPKDHGGWGMMESDDGIHFKPIKAPEIQAPFHIPKMENGGIRKIGGKYYFLAQSSSHFGFFGYSMFTYVSDSPTGPFRPDLEAYHLNGNSGLDGARMVQEVVSFVKNSPQALLAVPLTFLYPGTDGHGTWFLPMREAIVDNRGHLRQAYWKQNDLAKGPEIAADASQNVVAFPSGQTEANRIIKVAATQDSLLVAPDKPWRNFPWLDATKTRKSVVVMNQKFDLDKGLIMEGRMRAANPNQDGQSYAGFYVEGTAKAPGTAIMLQVGEPMWRTSAIGKLRLDGDFSFEPMDVTGKYSASVTGLDDGKEHTFRLWLRGGQMELYIDDLLMQSFLLLSPSGRIGVISQESEVQFSELKFYSMNL